jgi:hypothetical protein
MSTEVTTFSLKFFLLKNNFFFFSIKGLEIKPGVVAHVCNPSTQEAEAGESQV